MEKMDKSYGRTTHRHYIGSDTDYDRVAHEADSIGYQYVPEAELDNHYYHTPALNDRL